MPKAGRRERQRNKCCTSNLNSGSTLKIDEDLSSCRDDETMTFEEPQRRVLPERVQPQWEAQLEGTLDLTIEQLAAEPTVLVLRQDEQLVQEDVIGVHRRRDGSDRPVCEIADLERQSCDLGREASRLIALVPAAKLAGHHLAVCLARELHQERRIVARRRSNLQAHRHHRLANAPRISCERDDT
jgi:hypothetical protein